MFERLTKRKGNRTYFVTSKMPKDCNRSINFCQNAKCKSAETRVCPYLKVIDTLAAYEDTGLSPSEITALQSENAQLKKQLDKAVEDIDHYTCRLCKHYNEKLCYGSMFGADYIEGKNKGIPYCITWQYHGLEADDEKC